MNAAEFVLVPKEKYLNDKPLMEQISENPKVQSKAKSMSILQRYHQTNEKPRIPNDDDEERSQTHANRSSGEGELDMPVRKTIFDQLSMLKDVQLKKSAMIFEKIVNNPTVSVDNDGIILINNNSTGLEAATFLYNLQQSNKNIDEEIYKIVIELLQLPEHIVSNRHARQIITRQRQGNTGIVPENWIGI